MRLKCDLFAQSPLCRHTNSDGLPEHTAPQPKLAQGTQIMCALQIQQTSYLHTNTHTKPTVKCTIKCRALKHQLSTEAPKIPPVIRWVWIIKSSEAEHSVFCGKGERAQRRNNKVESRREGSSPERRGRITKRRR